mmetsp:Transcript_15783/g.61662  ORF Transcript_15783/g.61662 Transcript_15783/m.61662 type:complete len:386 (-) Transcript_15783:228-1385(-)
MTELVKVVPNERKHLRRGVIVFVCHVGDGQLDGVLHQLLCLCNDGGRRALAVGVAAAVDGLEAELVEQLRELLLELYVVSLDVGDQLVRAQRQQEIDLVLVAHALRGDALERLAGSLSELCDVGAEESEEDRQEALVDDEVDVDPHDVLLDVLEGQLHQKRVALLAGGEHVVPDVRELPDALCPHLVLDGVRCSDVCRRAVVLVGDDDLVDAVKQAQEELHDHRVRGEGAGERGEEVRPVGGVLLQEDVREQLRELCLCRSLKRGGVLRRIGSHPAQQRRLEHALLLRAERLVAVLGDVDQHAQAREPHRRKLCHEDLLQTLLPAVGRVAHLAAVGRSPRLRVVVRRWVVAHKDRLLQVIHCASVLSFSLPLSPSPCLSCFLIPL